MLAYTLRYLSRESMDITESDCPWERTRRPKTANEDVN
jgi:hypothetical protein